LINRSLDNENVIEEGQLLYETLLNNVHQGNIEEMFNYFKNNVTYIDSYGYTTEKKLLNYCTYKPELTKKMYGAYKK